MKKKIILATFWVLSTNSWGQYFKQGGLEYCVQSDRKKEVWVNKNISAKGTVKVPNEVRYKGETYIVSGIGSSAFDFDLGNVNRRIDEVILPPSIRRIQDYAFKGSSLSKIIIPEGVENIEVFVFSGCESLEHIELPPSLKVISAYAFSNCKSIRDLEIPPSVTYIGDGAFQSCCSLTSIVIPNSVLSIGGHAFFGCTSLSSVVLSTNIDRIRQSTFSNCDNLRSINIPKNAVSIEDWAFSGCTSLKQIEIPFNVNKIGHGAFSGCTSLEHVKGLHLGMTINDDFIGTLFNLREYKNSFDYYAILWITSDLKEWLKKEEFETNEQYQVRVSEEKRKEKVQELMAKAISTYTKNTQLT